MVKSFAYIEYDWLYKFKLTDIKEGDYLLFEMDPVKDVIKSHIVKIVFKKKKACISKKFYDRYFYSSRYIRVIRKW